MEREWQYVYSTCTVHVLPQFPCFTDPRIVSIFFFFLNIYVVLFIPISTLQMINAFCQLSGLQREVMNARWLSCKTCLFKYAPLEHKN